MSDILQASIIIPTYKRAAYLSKCLAAVAALQTDPATFEVIIVDNNSPDNTQDVSLKFAQAHPGLQVRYLYETEQGYTAANNRGVAEARSELLCFLDDDSPPETDWLNALLEPFKDPQVGCTGGPSILNYQGQEVPLWLRGTLAGMISGYVLPYAEPTPVSLWTELPLGCNMAIRRSVFADIGFFRTDLGKSGDNLRAGGETQLIERIYQAGWKIMYVPGAKVHHFVSPERLDVSYIYRRGRGLAETYVVLTADTRLSKVAGWFVSDLKHASHMFFWLMVALVKRKQLWFDDYMRFWIAAQRLPLRLKIFLRDSK
jgi:GT2 family glycosyltransferase